MFEIKENYSLKHLNTFALDISARLFARARNMNDLTGFLSGGYLKKHDFLILGKGSNILFTRDFEGVVFQPDIKGIEIVEENNQTVVVEAGAGEDWDDFVQWCVSRGFAGVENLSYIPGSTGSAPIQNIGAYGAEAGNVIEKVNFIDLKSLEPKNAGRSECRFGYRDSVFKRKLKNKVIITSVVFRLFKNPFFNTSYGNLKEETEKLGKINLENIRKAVISIRRSKLPEPSDLGNAGSFFKNPVVPDTVVRNLKESFSDMPVYPLKNGMSKIPAGWLIEKCGWKGKRKGDAGVHSKQALVIVNYGGAGGNEIFDLASEIKLSVLEKFGIDLEPEVVII